MLLLPVRAFGYTWGFDPRLSSSINWDDNIDGDPNGEEISDTFIRVSPTFSLTGIGKTSSLSLGLSTAGEAYFENEENNEFFKDLTASLIYNQSMTNNLDFRFGGRFVFSRDAEDTTETITVEGEEGIPISREITGREDRYRVSLDPSITYRFTPRLSSTLRGGYDTTRYSGQRDPDLSESETYSAGVRTDYAFTRTFSGGLGVEYSDTDFKDENDGEVYTGEVFLGYVYTRNVSFSLSGGASRSRTENEESSTDYIGSAGTELRYENVSARINVSRSVSGAGGSSGDIEERDTVSASISFPFLERGSFSVSGSLRQSKSKDGDEDRINSRIAINSSYPVLEKLSLFFSASHSEQEDKFPVKEFTRINRVSVGFELSLPGYKESLKDKGAPGQS